MTFDLDIILAAHGAGDNSPANARVRQWARELESTYVGARAVAAFHLGTPSYDEALDSANRFRRIVIPCLTSDGFHADRLRDAVRRAEHRSGGKWAIQIATPIGCGGEAVHGIARRVQRRLGTFSVDPSRAVVVVVGHGTNRHERSANATRALAESIERLTRTRSVVAFLADVPTVDDTIAMAHDCEVIVVVPFLVGGGPHVLQDLPELIRLGNARRVGASAWVTVLDPPGDAEMLNAFERAIDESRHDRTVVYADARGSTFSHRQVEIFAKWVHPRGVDVRRRLKSSAEDGASEPNATQRLEAR